MLLLQQRRQPRALLLLLSTVSPLLVMMDDCRVDWFYPENYVATRSLKCFDDVEDDDINACGSLSRQQSAAVGDASSTSGGQFFVEGPFIVRASRDHAHAVSDSSSTQ